MCLFDTEMQALSLIVTGSLADWLGCHGKGLLNFLYLGLSHLSEWQYNSWPRLPPGEWGGGGEGTLKIK